MSENLEYERLLKRYKSLQKKYIRNTKSLRKQKRYLRQVIDLNPNYIFAKDREGRFTLVNQTVANAYGTTPQNLIGKTDADYNNNLEQVENFKKDDLWVMDNNQDLIILEEKLTDVNGNTKILTTIKRPIKEDNGDINQTLGVATDITLSKQLQDELQQHRERLEHLVLERTKALAQSQEKLRKVERMAAIGALAAGIAHEINNPIGATLLTIENTIEESKEVSDLESLKQLLLKTCDKVNKNTNRVSSIVRGVLTFAQSQTNSERWMNQINPIIMQACELINQIFPKEKKSIELNLDPNLPLININPLEIEQVLINLIKNSIESSEQLVKVKIQTKSINDNAVIIEIEDDGTGIQEEIQNIIFEPFFTTRNNSGGSGLGLSIVKDLIDKHRGTIEVESRMGLGSKFSISIPAGR